MLLANEINADAEHDTYYVLGTMGSHREYFSRYPEDHAVYKPDMGGSLEAIGNAYDNTVLYLDKFIDALATKLNDKNAIVIYVSDHGESLGENGVFLHGAPFNNAPKEQTNVPMIVWMSDKFVMENPEKHQNIQQWAHANRQYIEPLSHDHLFHSLLDCAGIQSASNGIDSALSVCARPPASEYNQQL